MTHYHDTLWGLWFFYIVCGLLVLAMWYLNRNTPRGS
jgi:hypothetical protein